MTTFRPWAVVGSWILLLLELSYGSRAAGASGGNDARRRWTATAPMALQEPTRSWTAAYIATTPGWGPSTSSLARQHRQRIQEVAVPPPSRVFPTTFERTSRLGAADGDDDGVTQPKASASNNPLDFIFNPYESKIPKEVEADIYRAEANTPAAQNRGQRIAMYVSVAMVGVLGAFFNAFLSELRASPPQADAVEFDLATSAFAWVLSSGITKFLFLNKIGGGILLLAGAGSGLLAEVEWDSRRLNAEKIWEELQRRRSDAERKQANKLKKSKASSTTTAGGKTSLGKKKAKRLSALTEVVADTSGVDTSSASKPPETSQPTTALASDDSRPEQADTVGDDNGGGGGGLFRGIKDMYDKADAMAASQALLLNKQLEDAGLLEKITDETGLKVVGRKAAASTTKEEADAPAE